MKKIFLGIFLSFQFISGLQARNVYAYFYDVLFKYKPDLVDHKTSESKSATEPEHAIFYKHLASRYQNALTHYLVGVTHIEDLHQRIKEAFSDESLKTLLEDDRKNCQRIAGALQLEETDFLQDIKPEKFMVDLLRSIKETSPDTKLVLVVKMRDDFFQAFDKKIVQKKYPKEFELFDDTIYCWKFAEEMQREEMRRNGSTLLEDEKDCEGDITIASISYDCFIKKGTVIEISSVTLSLLKKLLRQKFLSQKQFSQLMEKYAEKDPEENEAQSGSKKGTDIAAGDTEGGDKCIMQ